SDKKKILLIHHKAYDVWQQPGGHWEESESDPLKAARREGEEETGLKLGKNIPLDPKQPLIPFDIDSHPVPARPNKDEPAHYHHGFRYIFLAEDVKPSHQIEEVLAAGWFKLDDSRTDRIQKVIKKMQAAGILLQ
ncbi:MAG TPA: NUDIX domain-containing protein, partial [Candidatus Saccharimonadales bacterium]|nr:NUDIX domain-containing protein [Candidatus Saccharimonadales bacterium]